MKWDKISGTGDRDECKILPGNGINYKGNGIIYNSNSLKLFITSFKKKDNNLINGLPSHIFYTKKDSM